MRRHRSDLDFKAHFDAFDQEVAAFADREGLVYSRYADDLSLSTTARTFTREGAARVIGQIYQLMGGYGLSPNRTKTKVIPPGARKVVLGLLVDGPKPPLSREFLTAAEQVRGGRAGNSLTAWLYRTTVPDECCAPVSASAAARLDRNDSATETANDPISRCRGRGHPVAEGRDRAGSCARRIGLP